MKHMVFRHAGQCAGCGIEIQAGTSGLWDSDTKKIYCLTHAQNTDEAHLETESEIETGLAGRSANEIYEKLSKKRSDRLDEKFEGHPLVRKLVDVVFDEPQSIQAWKTGAKGEEGVGANLDKLAAEYEFIVLHDRKIPGSRANIDHIAITGSGVYVIDAKNYRGLITAERKGGVFSSEPKQLRIDGRDQTKLVDGVKRQVSIVKDFLTEIGTTIPVIGFLYFYRGENSFFKPVLEFDGVLVNGDRGFTRVAKKESIFNGAEIQKIAQHLSDHFEPHGL